MTAHEVFTLQGIRVAYVMGCSSDLEAISELNKQTDTFRGEKLRARQISAYSKWAIELVQGQTDPRIPSDVPGETPELRKVPRNYGGGGGGGDEEHPNEPNDPNTGGGLEA